jgi:SSS family transporter
MTRLSLVDFAIVAGYLLAITLIGSRFYRRHSSLDEYFLGSKTMKWLPVTLSVIAADTSAISYLGIPGWAYSRDMKLYLYALMYVATVPIVIRFFLPIYSRRRLYTAYEFIEQRFDLRVRLFTSLLFLLIRGSHLAVAIYAPALMMSAVMGVPLAFSVLATGLLTTLYTSLGGIRAVIWTDVIQVFMIVCGFGLIGHTVVARVPGGLSEITRVAGAAGKFNLFDFSLDWSSESAFWAVVIGGLVMALQVMATDQAIVQKYFCTGSSAEARRMLLFWGLLTAGMNLVLYSIGIALFVYASNNPDFRSAVKNPDTVLPIFAMTNLHGGYVGLVVASIFAGTMSTLSAGLNSLATASIVDFYQRGIRPGREEVHYMKAGRWSTVFWGLLGTGMALFAGHLGPLNVAFSKVHSLTGGIVLGVFLLGVWTKSVTAGSALLGAGLGTLAVAAVSWLTPAAFWWYAPVGCITTIVCSTIASLLRRDASVPTAVAG